jgi:hypothetical protein
MVGSLWLLVAFVFLFDLRLYEVDLELSATTPDPGPDHFHHRILPERSEILIQLGYLAYLVGLFTS